MGLTTTADVAAELAAIVTPSHVSTDPAVLARSAVRGVMPRALVRPGSVTEVSRVLVFAHDAGLAVVPRGSGSALGMGTVPRRLDLALDLTRLDRVLEYEPADVSIMVEAGMALRALDGVLAAHRQRLPLDPQGWRGRTVGGVLASNSSGPLRSRYGAPRDLLLGVRFVLADGSVVWGGSKVVKSVTGYDVPKLMVGAHGTLGVLVEAALRLHPQPAGERTWLIDVAEPSRAADLVADVFDSTLEPSRVEVLNAAAASALGVTSGEGIAVAVSIAGVDEAMAAQGEWLGRLAVRHGGVPREIDDGCWQRHAEPVTGTAPVLRIACLAANAVDTLVAVEALARTHGVAAAVNATAGAGALRVVLAAADPRRWLAAITTALRARLAPEGGSVVIERAPADLDVDVWGPVAEGELAVMRRLKAEFDPDGILNPGRFVGAL